MKGFGEAERYGLFTPEEKIRWLEERLQEEMDRNEKRMVCDLTACGNFRLFDHEPTEEEDLFTRKAIARDMCSEIFRNATVIRKHLEANPLAGREKDQWSIGLRVSFCTGPRPRSEFPETEHSPLCADRPPRRASAEHGSDTTGR